MVMQEAGEMYLETILRIQEEQGYARSIDVANRMGYSKPTISEQMKKFREAGLVSFDDEMHIILTQKGLKIAKKTYERHVAITRFLEAIGVSPATAENLPFRALYQRRNLQLHESLRKGTRLAVTVPTCMKALPIGIGGGPSLFLHPVTAGSSS